MFSGCLLCGSLLSCSSQALNDVNFGMESACCWGPASFPRLVLSERAV